MKYSDNERWERFQKHYYQYPKAGLALDLSQMDLADDIAEGLSPQIERAFKEMKELEGGAIANPDEKRMVGHYWLRAPNLAPNEAIRGEIEAAVRQVKEFAANVHNGRITGTGGSFKNYLLIGIGGSALGPQFLANALGDPSTDKIKPHFFDNTDPDGFSRVLRVLFGELSHTICIVISKSGGTKETRNGMLEAKSAYEQAGLSFEKHAVAVTQVNSELHCTAQNWLATFPMWDWVGGRTSETSIVGMLPAALQGFQIDNFLHGAATCDELTRSPKLLENPAMQLAVAWHRGVNGVGAKNMVILPYKDRLELFSKYLQQLVMESLGKECDRSGKKVRQGITVLGNKGSTDQHSYIQHIRDGIDNSFVLFIQVLKDGQTNGVDMGKGLTAGDYLNGFYLGTRRALSESGRKTLTIVVNDVSAFTVGNLIALFERAVGFYASLVNINAYHQPGVEAGKKAAESVLSLQTALVSHLNTHPSVKLGAHELGAAIGTPDIENVFKICERLARNGVIACGEKMSSPERQVFFKR
jgi:glucose-6-phosphate isomerase